MREAAHAKNRPNCIGGEEEGRVGRDVNEFVHLLWLPLLLPSSEFVRDSDGSQGNSSVMNTSSSPTIESYLSQACGDVSS